MICEKCVFNGKCSASNPSRTVCDDFKISCKYCKHNIISAPAGFTKIGKAKIATLPTHRCDKWNMEITLNDFCSWGK